MKPRTTDRGDLVDVSVTMSPIFDKDGAVVGASSTTRDISRDGTGDCQRRYKHCLELMVQNIGIGVAEPNLPVIIESTLGKRTDVYSDKRP